MKLPHLHWFRVVRSAPSCDYVECRCSARRIRMVPDWLRGGGYQPIDRSWPRPETCTQPQGPAMTAPISTETTALVEVLRKMVEGLEAAPESHVVWRLYDGPTKVHAYADVGRVLVSVSERLWLKLDPALAMRLGISLIVAGHEATKQGPRDAAGAKPAR